MKKHLKKIIIVIIILVIAGVAFAAIKRKSGQKEYLTEVVKKGHLIQIVDATGVVESVEKFGLNFKISGRLSQLNVKIGNHVKIGQVLAILEAGALQSKVQDTQAALLAAQADLEKLKAGASWEDIKVSELKVKQKEQAIKAAQNDLVSLLDKKDTELANLKSALLVTLNNEVIVAQGSLETIKDTLTDDDAGDTLGIKDFQSVSIAWQTQEVAEIAIDSSYLEVLGLSLESDDQSVFTAATNLLNALNRVKLCLQNVLKVLENTITSHQLSEAELDSLKTNIKTEQTSTNTSRTNITTAANNFTNKKASYDNEINSAQNSIESAKEALAVAQAELELKRSSPRDFEIKSYEARVAQAQANLNLAQANLNDTIIRAPASGVITKVNYEKGEQTSLSTHVVEMISQGNFQIKVDIPESDIIKVAENQEVEITLDAFGDDKVFVGQVTFVDPAETVIQDVVYYKVTVQFQDTGDVKSGMTANVTIITQAKESVLIVPLRAVKSKDSEKFVEVLENNNVVKEKVVEVGMKGDSGYEIISGVIEGQEVILGELNNK